MHLTSTQKFILLLSSCLWLSILACKKDNAVIEGIPKPQLTAQLPDGGTDSIIVGQSRVLRPQLNTRANLLYHWYINGAPSGTDSVLNFTATARGDYQIVFKASNTSGTTSASYNLHVWDKYENGFFIVNEGWFGHGTGNVNFYRYNTQTLEDSIFTRENPGKTLEPFSSTLEYGTIYNGKLYLVSKVGGPLVVADALTLKETGRIPSLGGNDWRAFVGIDNNKGLVSARTGLFALDLQTFTISSKIAGLTGQTGDMIKAGNYVFVLSQTDGVVILNAADYTIVKKLPGLSVAFARTPDGTVWAAGGKILAGINPTDLSVNNITVPFTVNSAWGAWHPGSITASTKSNVVYLAKNGTFSGGTTIYKYDGNAQSLQNPFITLPTGKELYGAGIGYNSKLNQLVVTTVQSGFGANYSVNNLYFHDAVTGILKNDIPYTGYHFPAIPVFHN